VSVTTEYEEGSENVGVTVYARPDGFVSLKLHRYYMGEQMDYIYGIVLPPETARSVAQNLTLASIRAEELREWQDGMRDGE
jgi:hypothetical protein